MFSLNFEFFQFPRVNLYGYTQEYLYGKKVLYFFYKIAKKYKITSIDERREIFRVYIEFCKHGSQPISDQNSQMLYYNV